MQTSIFHVRTAQNFAQTYKEQVWNIDKHDIIKIQALRHSICETIRVLADFKVKHADTKEGRLASLLYIFHIGLRLHIDTCIPYLPDIEMAIKEGWIYQFTFSEGFFYEPKADYIRYPPKDVVKHCRNTSVAGTFIYLIQTREGLRGYSIVKLPETNVFCDFSNF
jgi:hypothetical protein